MHPQPLEQEPAGHCGAHPLPPARTDRVPSRAVPPPQVPRRATSRPSRRRRLRLPRPSPLRQRASGPRRWSWPPTQASTRCSPPTAWCWWTCTVRAPAHSSVWTAPQRWADVRYPLLPCAAPWCGHCQALEPEFEAAALLAGGDDPATLAKIDVTANQASARKYGVTQLPTVKLFRDGEMADEYSGQRTSGAIVDYLRQQGGGGGGGGGSVCSPSCSRVRAPPARLVRPRFIAGPARRRRPLLARRTGRRTGRLRLGGRRWARGASAWRRARGPAHGAPPR